MPFSDNTRSHFNSYIDISDLDYLHDDVEVAIKSIAFDNTQSIHILPNIKQPHFIIVQEVSKNDIEFWRENPRMLTMKSENSIKELINVEEPQDFLLKTLVMQKVYL